MNQRTRFASRYVRAYLLNRPAHPITTASVETLARNVLPEITPPELTAVVTEVLSWAITEGREVRP